MTYILDPIVSHKLKTRGNGFLALVASSPLNLCWLIWEIQPPSWRHLWFGLFGETGIQKRSKFSFGEWHMELLVLKIIYGDACLLCPITELVFFVQVKRRNSRPLIFPLSLCLEVLDQNLLCHSLGHQESSRVRFYSN